MDSFFDSSPSRPTGYGWMVTDDHRSDHDDPNSSPRIGVAGPGGIPVDILTWLMAGEGEAWVAYDDNGQPQFSGRLIIVPGECDDFAAALLGPLMDFAGYLGTTRLRVAGQPVL